MKILAIETSCDDTGAAVVEDGVKMLSNVISSQISFHSPFGGVVPELAFRKHTENVIPVIEQALTSAKLSLEQIDAVAVTAGPGLMGSLLVGVQTAKGIALTKNIPLIPVNHLEAHIHAVFLDSNVKFPFIALLVSGGHTHLYLVEGHGKYECLGQTLDDAVGEAFDKVARMMNLGYPGGPVIDKMAKEGDMASVPFPLVMLAKGSLDFSYSGLKTAVQYHIQKRGVSAQEEYKDIAASFQYAAIEVLVKKTAIACNRKGVFDVVISGGVACNSYLRKRMQEEVEKNGGCIYLPPPVLCTDNAGMVGACAYFRFIQGKYGADDFDARSRWPLTDMCVQGL